MAVYIRVLGGTVEGIAAAHGNVQQVFSPDDATEFTYGDAQYFRQKAFEHWPNFDWVIKEHGAGKYHV